VEPSQTRIKTSYIGLPSYSTLSGGLLHVLLLLLLHLLDALRHSRGVPPHAVVLQVQETLGWVAVDTWWAGWGSTLRMKLQGSLENKAGS
jgi:hypothetical protein